jgi:hypothetical protein
LKRAFSVLPLLALTACTTRFVEPDEGRRATLVLPVIAVGQDGDVYPMLHVFGNSEDCSERMAIPVGENRKGGAYSIPADDELSVGFISDSNGKLAVIPMPVGFVVADGALKLCNNIFTFTPRDGETYTASRALLSDACKFDLRDSGGAVVPVTRRVPIHRGRPSENGHSFCEKAAVDPAH